MKVKKAIIPAAGLGTRLLPATKAQPKEMLPIVDKPAIQYIVEEAVAAGIEDLIIVTGRGKRAIEDHFDTSYELEETLAKRKKVELLAEVQAISQLGNVHYIRQGEAQGLGHAIGCAKRFIGDEPFAVLLGDDIVQSDVPCIKQLLEVYEAHGGPVVGVQPVPERDVVKYGIVDLVERVSERVAAVKAMVEKPAIATAPSRFAIMGRYVLTPDIFELLTRQQPGTGGEIQLTDALNALAKQRAVFAYNFSGRRYDTGDKLNFIKATIEMALGRKDLSGELQRYLESLVRRLRDDRRHTDHTDQTDHKDRTGVHS
ncbi:UTP--glucose-1-phosphate uridylyltransferase GalU [Numidum massiliense]|uniref:UTP--glucose-1-phosphate uridylyltransferase GalU n=1 Tax=Numidum massiliense TaxID=1522315 RepID=UPI00093CE2C1|nr:UTP--glucose-1-phosphate uridylyltransferase GalU [Numidum massiliense]